LLFKIPWGKFPSIVTENIPPQHAIFHIFW
jgi:hypothetical protein